MTFIKDLMLSMQVLDCNGTASTADTLAGLDWVAQHAEPPAVVSMSLGAKNGTWGADRLDQAARTLAEQYNLTVVAAAGMLHQLYLLQ